MQASLPSFASVQLLKQKEMQASEITGKNQSYTARGFE
jgi:hypothetical protein